MLTHWGMAIAAPTVMRTTTLIAAATAVLVVCSACNSDSTPTNLGPEDASPTEFPGVDAGPLGGIPTTPTVCAIAAKLASSKPDASDSVMPSTHEFTLLIDWAGNTATTGSGGTANQVSLVYQDGVWTTQAPLQLSRALAGSGVGDMPFFTYDQIAVHPTSIGCAGHATGNYVWNASDMIFTIPFSAVLAGVTDWDVPVLSLVPKTQAIHPLDFQGVSVSELLPAGTTADWVASAGGAAIPLSALPAGSLLGVSGFLLKDRALAFGSSYWLNVRPAATDLAGNLASKPNALTTLAGPGFLAQDGFEATLDALLDGKVKVVDATSVPIPTGAKALRFAPSVGTYGEAWACDDRFTARLAVATGAQAVRLRALSYQPKSSTLTPFDARLRLAVPNGAVSDFDRYWSLGGVALPASGPIALPANSDFNYGDLKEYTFALPPGIGGEVIVDIFRPCWEPMFAGDGLIIDDLRVE